MKKISKYLLAFYFLIRLGALTPIIEIIGPYKTQEKCQEWASSDKFKDLAFEDIPEPDLFKVPNLREISRTDIPSSHISFNCNSIAGE